MSIVSIDNVTHMYGDKITFKNISFRLLAGEHAGLVGRNGTGKSTLLRLLRRELLPDNGRIDWLPNIKTGFLQQHTDIKPGLTIHGFLQTAYDHLFEIEKNMREAADRMAADPSNAEQLLTKYGEWQAILDQLDFYEIDTKIEHVARGLGLTDLGMYRDAAWLSGGQRTKLLLGKLLLEAPDVLLLDEPTNYLDDIHIEWLADYLNHYPQAFIVVSHDESFLNAITQVIFHLEHQTIKRYKGNYEAFVKNYDQRRQQQLLAYERQQQEIQKLERFIDKNRNRKAKQAKSREKMLNRIERIDQPNNTLVSKFTFRIHRPSVSRVAEADHLEIGYTHTLLGPVDLLVKRGQKIAITGYNGIGKTTMLKTLLGYLTPMGGSIQLGEHVTPAYFAQEEFSSDETPLERIASIRPDMNRKESRQALARVGLNVDHWFQPLRSMSGGEQTKVRLCELMLTASNVLVLDEPTNHLDVMTKEVFQDALSKYEGTILLVSHEPSFYENWVTDVWNVEDWPAVQSN